MKTLFSLFFVSIVGSASAVTIQPNEFLIQAHGVIVVPPCHINNDTTVDIDFGNVGYKSIHAGNINISTWVPVYCEDNEAAYSLKITGSALSDKSNILETSIKGLGIALSQADNDIVLNELFVSSDDRGVQLDAKLLLTEEFDTSSEGLFTAHATMTTQYD